MQALTITILFQKLSRGYLITSEEVPQVFLFTEKPHDVLQILKPTFEAVLKDEIGQPVKSYILENCTDNVVSNVLCLRPGLHCMRFIPDDDI